MSNVIRLKDPTTHGGNVTNVAATHSTVGDLSVACVGDSVSCPVRAPGTIIEGEPRQTINGIQLAYGQGRLKLRDPTKTLSFRTGRLEHGVSMLGPCDPGDQTVPLHSADHQLHSGKFKGIFRQSGYEHQDSYQDERALHSTLYSLVKIASTMIWSEK